MLTHRIYYKLKPLIPRSLQISIRRVFVKRKKRLFAEIWPIDEGAGTLPEGWQGWPEGKKFAFVLTHDVETKEGQKKCRNLAEIEMELGFRSSFNFVAEDYWVDRELQRFLLENGFEIGVHGLNHRGNMFCPPKRFFNEAPKINYYLREWKALGFRAPSMYRDFKLLHFLDILYDSSGFDTDPFEPQPDGLRTIFPLWIPHPNSLNEINPNNKTCPSDPTNSINSTNPSNPINSFGFVELPYTLPQDHTLFLLLKEKDCSIWKTKLDWIAKKGGMALILTHTDYMSFNGSSSKTSYSIDYYIKFLEYVKSIYSGNYWHKLPCEVAQFFKNFYKTSRTKTQQAQ